MINYIIYQVKEGDTLESIAETYQISISDLIRFHNSNSGITQYINSDGLPPFISSIFIKTVENKNSSIEDLPSLSICPNTFGYKLQDFHHYELTIKNSVIFLGKKITENCTNIEWEVDFNTPKEGYLRVKELARQKIIEFPKIDLVDIIMGAINEATNELLFRLDAIGKIDMVLNDGEIQKKWSGIKKERLKTLELNIPELTTMFDVCDDEFINLSESIQSNLLYNLFLLPISKVKLVGGNISKYKVLSQFFQPYFIPYNQEIQVIDDTNNKVQLSLKTKIDQKILSNQFNNIFKEKYEAITQKSLNFNYKMDGDFLYLGNGLLEKSHVYIQEQVNENCFYTAEYEFKLKTS